MAEAEAASVHQRDDREPIMRVSVHQPSLLSTPEDDEDDYTVYGDGDSYLDLSEEMALSNIYNELEISRICRSFGVLCAEDLNYLNNARGRKSFRKMRSCGTQTKHETGRAPLPWIMEVKDKTDCLYTELSNVVNSLLHTPHQNDKGSSAANKTVSPLLRQESSEDPNKNMTYWFRENGAWKSLLHPGIQIPCSVAAKEACANKRTPSKGLEEKLKNILKIVVEMKNLIPVVSDKMEGQPQLSDNLPESEPHSSNLTKLERGVQTEKTKMLPSLDADTSTLAAINGAERVESDSSSLEELNKMSRECKYRDVFTQTEFESFVSDLSAGKSIINFNLSQEHINSPVPLNQLLTPMREILGSGDGTGLSLNQEIAVGAGESLYTFSTNIDSSDTEYASEATIVEETAYSGSECTTKISVTKETPYSGKNDQNLTASTNEMLDEGDEANVAARLPIKNLELSEIGLKSRSSCLSLAKKFRNQAPFKGTATEPTNGSKVMRQRPMLPSTSKVQKNPRLSLSQFPALDKGNAGGARQKNDARDKSRRSSVQRLPGLTFGKGISSQSSSKSAQKKSAHDLATVTRSTSKFKLVKNTQPNSSIFIFNNKSPGKTTKERSEVADKSESSTTVGNSSMGPKCVAGPSKVKPASKIDARSQATGAIARNPKPVTAQKVRVLER